MAEKNNIAKKIRQIFCLTALCTLISICPKYVNATDWSEVDVTEKEKAVFAYFRAANIPPDYDFWIQSQGTYNALPEAKQERYLIDEMLRLGRGYSLYDNERDILNIQASIISKYIPGNEDSPSPRLIFDFFNADEQYIPTFDYPYGTDSISLIVNNLAHFSNLKLKEAQDTVIKERIPYQNDYFDAVIDLRIRVRYVDFARSIRKRNGNTQWVMVGEIAYIKCTVNSFFGQKDADLWDYVAPWYEDELRLATMPDEEKYPHPYDLFKD
ncbi:MAG: hypothetical protein ACRBDL_08415 [Alphaproteobacteria bacterium]